MIKFNTIYRIDELTYLTLFSKKLDTKNQKQMKYDPYKNISLIMPTGDFYNQWNLIIMLILVQLAIQLPLTLAFEDFEITQPAFIMVNLIINIFFLVDILINFNTAYIDEATDKLVTARSSIAYQYLKSWFPIDFFSSIPINETLYYLQGPNTGNNNLGNLAKVLRLLKYWRLIKIMRMSKTLTMIKRSEFQKNIVIAQGDALFTIQKITTSTLVLLFLCHIIVCIRMAFAKTGLKEGQNTWWWVQTGGGDDINDDAKLFATSWQWAVQTVTTVGQGDVPNILPSEQFFCVVTMIVGVGVFGDFVGNVTNYDSSDSLLEKDRLKKEEQLTQIKNKYNIKGESLIQLDHVLSKLSDKRYLSEQKLINKLPHDKSRQVFQNIKQTLSGQIQFFNELSLECFIELYQHIVKKHQGDRDLVVMEEGNPAGMMILEKGLVQAQEDSLQAYKLTANGTYYPFKVGDTFGLADLFLTPTNCATLVASENTEVLLINSSDTLRVVEKFSILDICLEMAVKEFSIYFECKLVVLIIFHLQQLFDIQQKKQIVANLNRKLFEDEDHPIDIKRIQRQDIINQTKWWHSILGSNFDHFIFTNLNANIHKQVKQQDFKLRHQFKNQHAYKGNGIHVSQFINLYADKHHIEERSVRSEEFNFDKNSEYMKNFQDDDFISKLVRKEPKNKISAMFKKSLAMNKILGVSGMGSSTSTGYNNSIKSKNGFVAHESNGLNSSQKDKKDNHKILESDKEREQEHEHEQKRLKDNEQEFERKRKETYDQSNLLNDEVNMTIEIGNKRSTNYN